MRLLISLSSNIYSLIPKFSSNAKHSARYWESTVNLTDITPLHRTLLVKEVNLKFLSNKHNNPKFYFLYFLFLFYFFY